MPSPNEPTNKDYSQFKDFGLTFLAAIGMLESLIIFLCYMFSMQPNATPFLKAFGIGNVFLAIVMLPVMSSELYNAYQADRQRKKRAK